MVSPAPVVTYVLEPSPVISCASSSSFPQPHGCLSLVFLVLCMREQSCRQMRKLTGSSTMRLEINLRGNLALGYILSYHMLLSYMKGQDYFIFSKKMFNGLWGLELFTVGVVNYFGLSMIFICFINMKSKN